MFNKLYNKKNLILSNGLQVTGWAKEIYEPMYIILNRNPDQCCISALALNKRPDR